MKIYDSITEITGSTPLLRLHNYEEKYGINAAILAKLEYLNHAGSVKDRTALNMIEDAEKKGLIGKGSLIIEPTSGNTGIGLASVAAARGYRTLFTMPKTMSIERRQLLAAYGAEIVLTEDMASAVTEAERIHQENPGSIIAGQFVNSANPAVHFKTTGPEIWNDTDGGVDIFIAGVGTGGTLTGTAKYLRMKNPKLYVVALEPSGSPVLSGGEAGPHGLQGIGGGFVPDVLDTDVYDEVFRCTDEAAKNACRDIARCEGLLVGISAGAVIHAAKVLAKRPENAGKNIVVILPDSGERYLSGGLFD